MLRRRWEMEGIQEGTYACVWTEDGGSMSTGAHEDSTLQKRLVKIL